MRAAEGKHGQRVLAPVTNPGDAIGVLELFLDEVTEDVLRQVSEAAHALAYIIVTDRRFTAETQRQLLPSAPSCEAAQFSLAGALVPASDIAGDSSSTPDTPDRRACATARSRNCT